MKQAFGGKDSGFEFQFVWRMLFKVGPASPLVEFNAPRPKAQGPTGTPKIVPYGILLSEPPLSSVQVLYDSEY